MRRFLVVAVAVVVGLSAFAQKKKQKQELPDAVLVAQYVYVTGWHGDELQFRSLQEERAAIIAVQDAVRAWGRYHLVFHPDEADLMLVVKPGYLGMVQSGVNVGVGSPTVGVGGPQVRTGTDYGAEATNPDDYLMVSIMPKADAQQASYIWRRGQKHGLDDVRGKVALFEEFRKTVDESDRVRAANKKP